MWISTRCKELGTIDISSVIRELESLDESRWYENEDAKQALAGDRPTQSLFLYALETPTFFEILSQRSLTQSDIPRLAAFEFMSTAIQPLIDFALSHYPSGGVLARVQLARMLPGTIIESHTDHSRVLMACHRLHIPLVTNNKIRFMVDTERVEMKAGHLYELNNRVEHSVTNPKNAEARIHLIIDYLPPQHNSSKALEQNFDFFVRKNNAKKTTPKTYPAVDLPTLIATSVVRGAHQNESHGGVYLVNMKSEKVEQVVDWNTCDIDFSGRGWDRGLRGICFFDNKVLIAGSDEIFFYDKKFNLCESYKNDYLRHAHEIMIDGRFLYVTSTGFDCVLRFNLRKKVFDLGWHFSSQQDNNVSVKEFDPLSKNGPFPANQFHINNAFFEKDRLYVSGRKLENLLEVHNGKVIAKDYEIPMGTHNVKTYNKGIIYNDTDSDQVVYSSNYDYRSVDVPHFEFDKLLNTDLGDENLARQGFGRGLCPYKSGIVFAGSSPSTITAFDFRNKTLIKSVNVSMDIRNAIHGLEVWPYH